MHPFIYLYITNVEKIVKPEESFDRDFLIDMLMCAALPMFMHVYIGEEDQHELYFLQKKIRENGIDRQSFMNEILGNSSSLNSFFNVNGGCR